MLVDRNAVYLETRVAILRSRLLPRAAIEDLIEHPTERHLNARLGLREAHLDLDVSRIERAMLHALLADLAIIVRPLTEAARDFFIFWARRFDLFNLKALIRGKFKNLSESEVARHLQDIPAFAVLPHEKLLRTESVAELLRQIEAGPYGDIARQARQTLEQRQDTLAVEAAIDQRYYSGLIKRVHRLPRNDREAMHALLGIQVDRLNLSWLIRYRFAYELSPSETYYYLIRHGYHLNRKRLLRLVELQQCDAVIEALPAALRQPLQGAGDSLTLELRLDRLVLDSARRAAQHRTSALVKALAYLILRENELKRLFAIIQGRRLGLDPELIRIASTDRALGIP